MLYLLNGACWRHFLFPFTIRPVSRATFFITLLAITPTGYTADCDLSHPAKLVEVTYIHDGDTFFTSENEKIRLIGLDTPEFAYNGNKAEPFAEEAQKLFRQLSKSSSDRLYLYIDNKQKDRYERSLAHVFLQNGKNVAQHLLEAGLATTLIIPPNISFADCYLAAQENAQLHNRGIWQLPQYQVSRLTDIDLTIPSQYRLVTGIIHALHSGQDNQKIIIRDDNIELVMIIKNSEKLLFESLLNDKLIGKKILVQGWINQNKDGLYIYIRHPGFIRVLS